MSDLNHIPKDKLADIQEFYANSSSAGQSWYTWKKPRNVIFVNVIVLGGGGGGAPVARAPPPSVQLEVEVAEVVLNAILLFLHGHYQIHYMCL